MEHWGHQVSPKELGEFFFGGVTSFSLSQQLSESLLELRVALFPLGHALSPRCVWWDVSCGLLWGEMLSSPLPPPPPSMLILDLACIHRHLAPLHSGDAVSLHLRVWGTSGGGLPAQDVSTSWAPPSSTRQPLHALEIPVSELIINHSRAHGDGIRLAQGWCAANPGPMGHPMVLPL